MKTLLERATPELLAGIKLEKEKYPSLMEYVENFLTKNYYTTEITWGVWVDIKSAYLTANGTTPESPFDLFK